MNLSTVYFPPAHEESWGEQGRCGRKLGCTWGIWGLVLTPYKGGFKESSAEAGRKGSTFASRRTAAEPERWVGPAIEFCNRAGGS